MLRFYLDFFGFSLFIARDARVRRGSARANIRRRAVVLEPVRSVRRGGGREAFHPLVERLLLEQKRALERVYFAVYFLQINYFKLILNKQTLIEWTALIKTFQTFLLLFLLILNDMLNYININYNKYE